MKIALVCTEKLPVPPIAGGAVQLYIDGILPYLSKIHEVTVFSIMHPGLPGNEKKDGVKHIRVPANSTEEYLTNLKAAINSDFDLIHVFNRPLWIVALSEKLPGVKFSLSLHNEMFHPEKIKDNEALAVIKKVEFINTVSKFIADGVIKRFPIAESKMRVVYSGVDSKKYHPVWTPEAQAIKKIYKEKLGLTGYKVILFVGRLSVKKGVHILLKAVKKVMSANPKVALVIVGSKWYGENKTDDYTKSLKLLAKELAGPIVFTGFIPPSEIPSYYAVGDIFVCASQWDEPLARVHYEAMAAGLPIITTNRGGNGEVIYGFKNGKIINDFSNPDIFANCINYFLSEPSKCIEVGKNGRKAAEEKYSWERVASEIIKHSVINQPSELIKPLEKKNLFLDNYY